MTNEEVQKEYKEILQDYYNVSLEDPSTKVIATIVVKKEKFRKLIKKEEGWQDLAAEVMSRLVNGYFYDIEI